MRLKIHLLISCCFLTVLLSAQSTFIDKGWQNLFNGKDLGGWKRLGGKAEYTVEDGVVVGRTVMNSRNTFLVTEKEYGDFVLEMDVWVEDEEGNAGIQTRSHFTMKAEEIGFIQCNYMRLHKTSTKKENTTIIK
jgi:hypothetical protein